MEIKLALTSEERFTVYRFRYSVIVDEMGVLVPSADQVNRVICDADDERGHLFMAIVDGQIAGTARINFLREGPVVPHSDLLQLSQLPGNEAISVCSRFLVAKAYRGSLLTVRITQAIYRFMRQSGITFDFILVKSDLAPFYARLGYLPSGAAVTHPEVGDVVPLRLSILDEQHLRSIRSPLVKCLPSLSAENAVTPDPRVQCRL